MNAYLFQTVLLCENCGKAAQERFAAHTQGEDSDRYPQGPYGDGGGEADCPQHCDRCAVFLENPLTDDGVEYVRNAIERGEQFLQDPGVFRGHRSIAVDVWKPFYKDYWA